MNNNNNNNVNDNVLIYIQGTTFNESAPLSISLPRVGLNQFKQLIRNKFNIPSGHIYLTLETPEGILITEDLLLDDKSLTIIYAFTDAKPRITQQLQRE